MAQTATDVPPCWRCLGDGYFWRVPNGFNPFYAGGFQTARTMEKIRCYHCGGTGGGTVMPTACSTSAGQEKP